MHISKEYIVNADDSVNNIILHFVKHVNAKICKQIACKAVFLAKHEKFDLDYYKNEATLPPLQLPKFEQNLKKSSVFLDKEYSIVL